MTAKQKVTRHAAQQPPIGCLDCVTFVYSELGERRYVDGELDLRRHAGGVRGVERVNALHHKNSVGGQCQSVAGMIPISGFEIIARSFDGVSCDELAEVLIEQWDIHGLETVVVDGFSAAGALENLEKNSSVLDRD